MDNLAALAQRYVEAVERGDQFAHARGLELAEAVMAACETSEKLLGAAGQSTPEKLLGLLASELGDEARQVLMNGAGRLREEGWADGRRAMLMRQLELRFGDLSDDIVRRVEAAGDAQLDVWVERILTAGSAQEVLADDAPGRT